MKLKLKWNGESFFYLCYIILLYILAIEIWPLNNSDEFRMYQYILDINEAKLIFSIICSVIIWLFISQKYYAIKNFTHQAILLLIILYFLPGIVMAGALNFEWKYMIQYMLYFLVLMIADRFFLYPKHLFPELTKDSIKIARIVIIIVSLLYPFYMARVYSKSFSLTELMLTLNDPYGARMAARDVNIFWFILAIEYAEVYFDAILITHFIKTKRKALAIAFIVVGLFYFILQGNRQFVLFVILGIVFGFLNPNKKIIAISFLSILAIQFVEFYVIHNFNIVGPITNVYRRFCLVPNKISSQYFDYFQINQPDYLRGVFTRICSLLNLESPYGNNQIGFIIGNAYYGWAMNANNGLFGGAYFEFGDLGFIIDPVMFVLILRLIEKILYRADQSIKFITAIVFITIAINQQVIWAQSIKPGQYLLFLLYLLIFFNSRDPEKEGAIQDANGISQ